jgi:hypothetical protein
MAVHVITHLIAIPAAAATILQIWLLHAPAECKAFTKRLLTFAGSSPATSR